MSASSVQMPTAHLPEWSSKATCLFAQYTNGKTYPSDEVLIGMVQDLWNTMRVVSGKDRLWDLPPAATKALAERVRCAEGPYGKISALVVGPIFRTMTYPFPEGSDHACIYNMVRETRCLILPTVLRTMEERLKIQGARQLIGYHDATTWMAGNVAAISYGTDFEMILKAKRLTHTHLSKELDQEVWNQRTDISKALFSMTKEEGQGLVKALEGEPYDSLSPTAERLAVEYGDWCSETARLMGHGGSDKHINVLLDSVVAGIHTWLKKKTGAASKEEVKK